MKRYGAVIVFNENATKEECAAVLSLLQKEILVSFGPTRGPAIEPSKVKEYDDDNGSPVWYVP